MSTTALSSILATVLNHVPMSHRYLCPTTLRAASIQHRFFGAQEERPLLFTPVDIPSIQIPALPIAASTSAPSSPTSTSPSQTLSSLSHFKEQSSHDICRRIERLIDIPIQPLSINELLSFHTGYKTNLQSTPEENDNNDDDNGSPLSSSAAMVNHGKLVPADAEDRHANHQDPEATEVVERQLPPLPVKPLPDCTWESLVLRSANWVREEVSVRLAHRLHDFGRLPFVVVSEHHVFQVYQLYLQAFTCLTDFGAIKCLEDEERLTHELKSVVAAHGNVVALMQKGLLQLKQNRKDTNLQLDAFLDRLFGTRIGNRVLAESHIALHESPELFDESCFSSTGPTPPTLGVIHRRCKPSEVLKDVASKVQQVSQFTYGRAPDVSLGGELDLVFPYIPEHLRFVCFEVLKNSIRATVERHLDHRSFQGSVLPPVHISIHKGEAHVVIKVSDEGGGLAPDLHEAIWNYGFSTVAASGGGDDYLSGKSPSSSPKKQMAGYGFGLPLSRLYSRYWGGNLDIKFMAGYGTDTYIFFPRLGNQRESEEMLNNCLYYH